LLKRAVTPPCAQSPTGSPPRRCSEPPYSSLLYRCLHDQAARACIDHPECAQGK
jgi:hypothetical protein